MCLERSRSKRTQGAGHPLRAGERCPSRLRRTFGPLVVSRRCGAAGGKSGHLRTLLKEWGKAQLEKPNAAAETYHFRKASDESLRVEIRAKGVYAHHAPPKPEQSPGRAVFLVYQRSAHAHARELVASPPQPCTKVRTPFCLTRSKRVYALSAAPRPASASRFCGFRSLIRLKSCVHPFASPRSKRMYARRGSPAAASAA